MVSHPVCLSPLADCFIRNCFIRSRLRCDQLLEIDLSVFKMLYADIAFLSKKPSDLNFPLYNINIGLLD